MGHGHVQRVVDRLAAELGRSVVVDDPAVRPLCTSPHYGTRTRSGSAPSCGATPVRTPWGTCLPRASPPGPGPVVPARPEIGMQRRLCAPVRHRGELLGLLLVMDADGSLTDAEVVAVEAAAREVAAWMVGDRRAEDAVAVAGEGLVAALLTGTPDGRRTALAEIVAGGTARDPGPVVATVLTVVPGPGRFEPDLARIAVRHAIAEARRSLRVPSLSAVRDRWGSLLLTGGAVPPERLVAQAERMAEAAVKIGDGRFGCAAGVGGPVPGLEQAWVSHRQAVVACRAATRSGGRIPRVIGGRRPVRGRHCRAWRRSRRATAASSTTG